MTLRILNTFVRGFRHSLVVDTYVIMTRKKCLVIPAKVNRMMASRLCTESGVKVMAQPEQECQDSDSESCIVNSDSECEVVLVPKTVKYLIVGLGNPTFQGARHSVGMRFVDRLAKHLGAFWSREQFKKTGGYTASVQLENNIEINILKPRVPMNLNGTSVIKAARFYSIDPENVYLIHDELDKPVGKFQIKEGGSASGHNGVKSVMNSLKSDVMPRLRIGIDRPADHDHVTDYVLDKFTPDEYKQICDVVDESVNHLIKHIGDKCGIELDIKPQKYSRQASDYDSEGELKFRFSKGHKFDRGNSRYTDNRKGYGYTDKRGYGYTDRKGQGYTDRKGQGYTDRKGQGYMDGRKGQGYKGNRRDYKLYDEDEEFEDSENSRYRNTGRDYDRDSRYNNETHFRRNNRNPIYFSDE